MIAYTIDTSDPEKEADHLRFSTEMLPKMEERSVELARRLVESGYRTPALETTLARFRTSIEIFREANVPIFSELEELSARYQRITGSMTVEWEGQERPLPQLQPFLKSPDRTVRERAFRAAAAALHRAARRAWPRCSTGCTSCASGRRGTPASPTSGTTSFPPSSASTTPRRTASASTTRSRRRWRRRSSGCSRVRRRRLSLDELRPWDLAVDPYRKTPLRPFATTERVRRHGARGSSTGSIPRSAASSRP